jgi:hypothetical protein
MLIYYSNFVAVSINLYTFMFDKLRLNDLITFYSSLLFSFSFPFVIGDINCYANPSISISSEINITVFTSSVDHEDLRVSITDISYTYS